MPDASPPHGSSLGPALEPVLNGACGGLLQNVRWFRSDWQRGGGSTGLATLSTPQGPVEVVAKIPVGPGEYRWTTALGGGPNACEAVPFDDRNPTPRVFAAGLELGGYDLAWVVMERLAGKPLAAGLDAQSVREMLHAAHRWHQAAARVAPVSGSPRDLDWEKTLAHSRDVVRRTAIPDAQKWNNILRDVHRALPVLVKRWSARAINTWCHGDLHPGNAMRRALASHAAHQPTGASSADGPGGAGVEGQGTSNEAGPVVLLDLALVHPGHWVEDALYLERVYWGHPTGLCGVNAVSTLAAARRADGLHDHEDYGLLANTRRVLMAASAPGVMEREGNLRYLHAAFEVIQKLLPMVGR